MRLQVIGYDRYNAHMLSTILSRADGFDPARTKRGTNNMASALLCFVPAITLFVTCFRGRSLVRSRLYGFTQGGEVFRKTEIHFYSPFKEIRVSVGSEGKRVIAASCKLALSITLTRPSI